MPKPFQPFNTHLPARSPLSGADGVRPSGACLPFPRVGLGSDCDSSKEAAGRRRTSRGERDAGARVPALLEGDSPGLVHLGTSDIRLSEKRMVVRFLATMTELL